MKSISANAGLLVCILSFAANARPIDISETISLERYTIVDDVTLQQDDGFMLKDGKFEVTVSTLTGTLGLPIDEFVPISGRPIIQEIYYDAYKSGGVIPKWTRSADDFYIGQFPYVIVSVEGKADPNPTITISEQPQSQEVLLGGTASFFVGAEPASYLSYQWLHNKKVLPGQTFPSLVLANVSRAEAGMYAVEMNTGGKKIISGEAVLKVVTPVTIKTEPKSLTVKLKGTVTFRVVAEGTSPFGYQWYFNAVPIPNATKSSHSISKANQTDAGNYAVVVTNAVSSATSTTATLTVSP
jgi:hypothetical protein